MAARWMRAAEHPASMPAPVPTLQQAEAREGQAAVTTSGGTTRTGGSAGTGGATSTGGATRVGGQTGGSSATAGTTSTGGSTGGTTSTGGAAGGATKLVATAVAAAWDHSCALIKDGTIWCWGNNSDGELGNQDPKIDGTAVIYETKPVQVKGVTQAISVATGDYQHVRHSRAAQSNVGVTMDTVNWVMGPREEIAAA